MNEEVYCIDCAHGLAYGICARSKQVSKPDPVDGRVTTTYLHCKRFRGKQYCQPTPFEGNRLQRWWHRYRFSRVDYENWELI